MASSDTGIVVESRAMGRQVGKKKHIKHFQLEYNSRVDRNVVRKTVIMMEVEEKLIELRHLSAR